MGTNPRERPIAVVGETVNLAIDCTGLLESGESLSGTPTVAEQTTSDLTISGVAVSSSALTINGRSVSAGAAVQCTVAGQLTANAPYTLKVTVTTDGSATRIRYLTLRVVDE